MKGIFYSDIKEKNAQYIYDIDMEKKLISSIGKKDYENSKKIIDDFFAHYVYSEEYTLGIIRAIIFDMAKILLRSIPKQNIVKIENNLFIKTPSVQYNDIDLISFIRYFVKIVCLLL